MKALMLSKLVMVAIVIVVLAAQAVAQRTTQPVAQQQDPVAGVAHRVILVSLEDHKLALVEDGQVKKIYTVAVGKPSTPSPVGTFTIERRVANPVYHHNGKTVAPGPRNPVGTRWMGLSKHGYGIHGTNEPNSIGKAASHGCIRMAQADLEELYPLVAVGDAVELVGERNEETAQLFGDGQNPAAPAQPLLTVAAPVPNPTQETTTDANTADSVSPGAPAVTAIAASR